MSISILISKYKSRKCIKNIQRTLEFNLKLASKEAEGNFHAKFQKGNLDI